MKGLLWAQLDWAETELFVYDKVFSEENLIESWTEFGIEIENGITIGTTDDKVVMVYKKIKKKTIPRLRERS
ncbi:hypothetical protein EVAR_88873_1 [Eumeta japonica]|uniref:Uncharacterized protein n=1 Tax=Eumeta variegata TaxID=151549 RepID=A0A4C1XV95_EUMVA|nr:hypothetical protein EVAR_88873_1 [Eumeta japonica]